MKNIKYKTNKTSNPTIRLTQTVSDTIKNEISALSKIKKGTKKVTPSDLIEVALSLLTKTQREQLLEKTVTGEDRQRVAFTTYKKKYTSVTKSEFSDLISYGEINIDDYLPKEMRRRNPNKEASL